MSSVITPSKTWGTSHLAWQAVASAAQAIGTSISVATARAIAFDIRLARTTGTAFTAGWPNVRIEAQNKSGGLWTPIYTYQPQVGASIANTTFNGAISAGATSCVVAANTNIAAGDILFLSHTTLTANYELVRVKSVSGTTITFEEACLFAHDTGAQITDQAEMAAPSFDVTTYSAVRAVVDNVGSGQGIAVQVLYTTYDSDSAT